jgi:hypothetical protein
VLAKKAGVEDPNLDRAIQRSSKFLRWYVGKGSIPYGDHDPWMEHDDNGKNGMGAVLFDLLRDVEATTYFSKMTTAAYVERESGHTGNFFNLLWALPGVSRSGPHAAGAHMKELAWYFDMARRWDGRFVYQGIPANTGGHSYNRWDSTGAYLLTYALPRRSLYILGKDPSAAPTMSPSDATAVIDAGRHFTFWDKGTSYDSLSDDALFDRLASWSPVVRQRAAQSLSHREGDYSARLLALLNSDDSNAQYGACEAIARLGVRASGDGVMEKLCAMLASDDPWKLTLVVRALGSQDLASREDVANELLELAIRDLPNDPRRMVQRAVTSALFVKDRSYAGGVLVDSLGGVDRRLLLTAVRSILKNEDGRTRGRLSAFYKHLKEDDYLGMYLPLIIEATREPAPSGVMFADGVRLAGLDFLSRMRIREGMPLCVELIGPDRWGKANRVPRCLESLQRYGGNARTVLPQLLATRAKLIEGSRKGADDPVVIKIDEAVEAITNDNDPPKLRDAKDFLLEAR